MVSRPTDKVSRSSESTGITFEARGLACMRHDRMLFSDLSFTMGSGDLIQVQGSNGSGKTSLLRMLCGMLLPEHGEILWCDSGISENRSEFLAQIAYVGHHDGIKKELTPRENLRLVRALGGAQTGPSLDDALEQVGLYGYEDVLTQSLSAGQRRRVALARILVTSARLWVLDEPFTALDQSGRELIERLLEHHAKGGGMAILTTHQAINLAHGSLTPINLDP